MTRNRANMWTAGRVPVVAAVLAMVLAAFGASSPAAAESVIVPAATVSQVEEELLVLTNEVRAQGRWCGSTWYPAAPPLRYDNRLASAARAHAVDTGVRDFYNLPAPYPHTNPDGKTPGDRITAAGFRWTTVGENMHAWWSTAHGAMFGGVINDKKYNGLVDSPVHCANLMNPKFTFVGNGYASVPGSDWNHYWVQKFAVPASGMTFAPDAPRIASIAAGDGTLTVNFSPPSWNGGRPVISYLYSIDGGANWLARNPASAGSPLVIGGLKNGTTYQVRLRALNDAFFTVGAGPGSNTVAATPKAIASTPGAPSIAAVTPVNGGVRVAFVAGTTGGLSLRSYEYSLNGGASWAAFSPSTPASPALISGLNNGTPYRIAIRAVNDKGPGPSSPVVTSTPYSPTASVFIPVNPVRVVDTRTTEGGKPLAAKETRTVSIAHQIAKAGGAQNVVPVGATAIAYNLTAPGGATAGSLSIMPGDVPSTATAAITYRPNESIANALTVRVDSKRQIRIANNSNTVGNAVVDVLGYYVPAAQAPQGGRFTPTAPTRVYDSAQDPQGSLAFNSTREIVVTKAQSTGTQVIPKGATAVSYVVTVVRPASGGHLRVYPGNEAPTLASTINWAEAGDVIANGLSVRISPTGTVKVYGRSTAPVRFLIDVVGYYQPNVGSQFYPVNPATVYDSRAELPMNGMLPWGQPSRVVSTKDARTTVGTLAAPEVVPTASNAIAYNVTVTSPQSTGHLRVYPADQPLPYSSVLNWPGANITRSNAGVVGVPANRSLALYSSSTGVHVVVDTLGYFK